MEKRIVGLIGEERETHTHYVAREISRQGGVPLILNSSPNQPFPLTLSPDGFEYKGIPLHEVESFFLRVLFIPTPAFDTKAIEGFLAEEGYVAYASERERYAAWLSFLKILSLKGKRVINPIDTLLLHFAKPYQLSLLEGSDLPIPRTLVTGNPEQVKAWASQHPLIYKPVAGGALVHRLTEEDLKEDRLSALEHAPVLFQEYVEGEDLRVFVLNGRVIGSFRITGEGVDYREGKTTVEPIHTSQELEELSIKAASATGLLFTGIDWKRKKNGDLVILECNPAPMFMGFDQVAKNRIVTQLVAELLARKE